MSSIGTLYTVNGFPNGQRILAVAALAGLNIDIAQNYKHHEDNLKPEFRAKFASGKIPAFETTDGFTIFETSAITRYVASLAPNSGLLGNSPKETALVDQWSTFVENEAAAPNGLISYMLRGLVPYNKPIETHLIERRDKTYNTLNIHLQSNTYLVSERITVADVQLASILVPAAKTTFDAPTRAKYPHLTRHFITLINHPKIKPIVGEIQLIDKAVVYTAPAKPKKEEKPKEAPKPKAEKPKKEEVEEEDEDDDIPKEAPKPKNPLDLLPKSSFNLEDWKRKYSNLDTRGAEGSLQWFYENYDKEGFSIWRADFKYNEELTVTFKSSNQVGGFFNRLEESRKYLFGSMGVLGEPNNSIITGAFVTRGSDILATIQVAPDWESYDFRRIDPFNNASDKEFFEAALAWDLSVGGKTWADGKVFK
ncbi:hypothetical protein Clacol_008294 [Clathrus columnatus]|uniref:Elongation factor 1-gamma n=1 Tax=Clathrus columnatus TaxID=1419009 RepID=A0AAV5AK41_9AGAM|nr:hypothetical protein Clacol_008294 [Clathrus columnatus]